jgi:FkbM family methyltransferase
VHYRHQQQNDRWIAEAVFPGLRGGFFVEAGAGGGKHSSATFVLETELGWSGICVEPLDDLYALLTKTRECATDNRCLWDGTGGSVEFTAFLERPPRSGIAAVNKNVGNRSGSDSTTAVDKETVTLEDLLVSHRAPRTIEYIALDLEGAERRVLEAFDLSGARFRVLAVSIEGSSCDDLLEAAGYSRATNPFTQVRFEHYFLHPELAASRPQLIQA